MGVPLDRIAAAPSDEDKVRLTAALILETFDEYYIESRGLPGLAKAAFERRDPATTIALSKQRLMIYSVSVAELGSQLKSAFPSLASEERLWREIERLYLPRIEGRYEADLAFAYIHSVRRKVYQDDWKPVEYAFSEEGTGGFGTLAEITLAFPGGAKLYPETVGEILAIPDFRVDYRDIRGDATRVAERVNRTLGLDGQAADAIQEIEMIDGGFYRNRGCYLVGRMRLRDGSLRPLVIALLNEAEGVFVDAVLLESDHCHNIFSSTLANFHVTNASYHELSEFLFSIMPKRPLGHHYSTIGFNHVGKVAVMNELKTELATNEEVFETAVGFRGTVAIGFSAPSSAYVLKVIRDHPTGNYKWGHFAGVASVLRKYSQVHEINRTGSMLDNIIYYNLKLDRASFDPALLEEILEAAGGAVSLQGADVVFKHLIVQLKMIPLTVFLETAAPEDAATAVVNLGHCIKNNAAANIFNKDLDGRNYGVSKVLKVYLYDYDALEPFTEVKIRTNIDAEEGEEDIPDWYFEDGVIFLPEEIESGLRINERSLRRLFREVHGDLMTVGYWQTIQDDLAAGRVPRISIYPEACRLQAED
ncbi:MAG: isocitrate dehydrogenase kinase/phosphatase AceK regulatory subunit [Pseudomonadota bacterium]